MTPAAVERLWQWTVVYAANLPVPLAFGMTVTAWRGLTGMLAAVCLLWLLGLVAVQLDAARPVLLAGGVVVALLQLVPVLHFVAGGVALGVAEDLFAERAVVDEGEPAGLSAAAGFVVTLLVAGQLLIAAVICGAVVQQITLWRQWRRADD